MPVNLPLHVLRVLYADDSMVSRKLVQRVLTQAGGSCTSVGNGQLAVNMLLEKPDEFDCILMDCNMPLMDGWTATKTIRQMENSGEIEHKTHKNIPIIGFTSNSLQGDMHKCVESGMDDYLVKSDNLSTKLKVLGKWTFCVTTLENVDGDSSAVNQGPRDEKLVDFLRGLTKSEEALPAPRSQTLVDFGDERQCSDPWDKMSQVVQTLVQSCCTQSVSVDIHAALTQQGGAWASFCDALALFVDSLPEHLRCITKAFDAKNVQKMEQAVLALKRASATASAVLMFEMSSLLELLFQDLPHGPPAPPAILHQVGLLIDGLGREMANLCNIGRMIRLHSKKLNFDSGVKAFRGCAPYLDALLSFCFFAVDQVQAVHQALLVGDMRKAVSIGKLLFVKVPSLHLHDLAQAALQVVEAGNDTSDKTVIINKHFFITFCIELIIITNLAVSVFHMPKKKDVEFGAFVPVKLYLEDSVKHESENQAKKLEAFHKTVSRETVFSTFQPPMSVSSISSFALEVSQVFLDFLETQLDVLGNAVKLNWICGAYLQAGLVVSAIDYLAIDGPNQYMLKLPFQLCSLKEKVSEIMHDVLLEEMMPSNFSKYARSPNGPVCMETFESILHEFHSIKNVFHSKKQHHG
mmetsp:Transcript_17906/g.24766  ORF Transcript_17906/g.24766 Transcript_17906/m.24766 type:complete len:634 (-) Transcript_17906:87-1988(-)|eukprot:CAMPEP_0196578050 /NCGR_PEP_ID=MMETSP1081-20130531/7023_1 /TAXON_ID=36882 /ORGANISM="Pyramimonas amylifera, Strain CCMP720" /LENGTH=633 /DNA_ID=CAMNT_0041897155 /DNA_START=369 /DNA_END=2270 /DNA_ORIENTATION=+